MKLAFSTPTSTLDDQRRLFTGFRPAGYEGLQLKASQYLPYLREPERFLKDWGAFPGAASALIFGGALDQPGQAALRDVLAFARSVGSDLVVFCHGVTRQGLTDDGIRGFARPLSDLADEARQQGVRLSLHHHFDQPVMHRADFDIFFDACQNDALGLTVDTAHLVKSGITDIAELIRAFASRIDNIHAKDFRNGQFQVLGRGDIDFAPVFAALREIGYDGWVCADEESGGDLTEGMAGCRRFLAEDLDDETGR